MGSRSHHAVGAALAPKSQQSYIQDWFDEQGQRQEAGDTLQDALLADPFERAQIAHDYVGGVEKRTAGLAARGLSEAGYTAGDIGDLERTRVQAEQAHALQLRTKQANFTATIARLNSRRTAMDKAYALEAGQNIQAGTGRFKHEKPAGWRPPSLVGAPAGPAAYTPPTAPIAPTAPRPAPTAPRTPTGARLSTGGAAPAVLGVLHGRPRLAGSPVRRRTRLA